MMEVMPLGPAENAAFNEILGKLEELIWSIDHFWDTTSNAGWLDVPRPVVSYEQVGKNNVMIRQKISSGNERSSAHSRHECGNTGTGKSLQDNLIERQIRDSRTGTHSELLETHYINKSTEKYYGKTNGVKLDEANYRRTGESHDIHVRVKTSTASQRAGKDTNYLANVAGNMTDVDSKPESKSISTFRGNNVSPSYRRRSKTNEVLIHDSYNSQNIPRHLIHNNSTQEKGEAKETGSENSLSSRGMVRRADTAPESDISEQNCSTQDLNGGEAEFLTKPTSLQRAVPYQSRTLSLKRAISRRFKRAKLKSGLPTRTHTEEKDQLSAPPANHKENHKKRNGLILSSKFGNNSEDLPAVTRGDRPPQRRATSLDGGQGRDTISEGPETFDPSSLLCYKKKKGSRKSFQYMRNSNSDGQEYGLKLSTSSESAVTPSSDSGMEINSLASPDSVDKSAENGQGSSKPFGSRDDPTVRRSTIGSSYLRETGKSTPNIYQNNGTVDSTASNSFSLKQHRHSLHVLKGQSVLSNAKNENRWSTEDGLLKGTSFIAQPPTQDIDKGFKASSIKHKSLFQKSTKSASRAANMSSVDRNKLTERTWNSAEYCVWCNMSGQRVELTEVDLLGLSESECIALQKVAEQRLREIDLGVSISVPKDESKLNRGKHNSSWRGVHLPLVAKNKSKKEPDRVFGIPLFRVVENDQLLRLQTAEQDDVTACGCGDGLIGNDEDTSTHSSSEASPKPQRRKSSSQDSSAEHSTASVSSAFDGNDHPSTPPSDSPLNKRRIPGRGFKERRPAGYAVISPEEKTLLASLMMTGSSGKNSKQSLLPPTMPQVPYVVQKCCAHILKHGLDVTGIFRIAGAKKRVKQLREEFDHGVDVKIDEDYHAHDVAALLKEFFRDLPEALLTRELYPAFISTAKLPWPQRLLALRCLVWLLPMPNRDTLQELLSFLATVAECSEDRIDSNGKQICGNKMGVANLSVIFGPNILHREKKTNQSSGEGQYQVQSMERAEESTFVIRIVDDMIRIHKELFSIPCETHDEILRTLQESDPDAVDYLLRRKAANCMKNGGCKTPNSVDGDLSDSRAKRFSSTEDDDAQEADQSDMNNNKNNNRQPESPAKSVDDHRSKVVDSPSSRNVVAEEKVRKISLGLDGLTSPRMKQGSISFTDEDLEEILGADGASARANASPVSEQDVKNTPSFSSEKTVNGNARTVQAQLPPKPRPRRLKLKPEPVPSHYTRRQAFSLDPHIEEPYEHQKRPPISTHAKTIPQNETSCSDRSTQSESTRAHRSVSGNSTSGFVEMFSSSSSGISTKPVLYYDDTTTGRERAFHPRRNGICEQKSLNFVNESPSNDNAMRNRLPSALHLRVNRTRGSDLAISAHSLRIPKTVQDKKSDVGLESSKMALYSSNGRRLSKDDMYMTLQEVRRRNDRLQNILI